MRALWQGVFLLFTFSFSISSTSTFAETSTPNVKTLLANVAHAVRNMNYRGRLTYEHSGKLDVIEIAHSVVDSVEYERVYYLNGPERSIVKPGRSLDCMVAGAALMMGGKLSLSDGSLARLESNYSVTLAGTERVAGRDTWVVHFIPKDQHRHRFILSIDMATYLPMKTLFVASGRKVLERLHFVSLEPDATFEPEEFGATSNIISADDDSLASGNSFCLGDGASIGASKWKPRWVPGGFVRTSYSYSEQDGHMETYTDGLTSFSIFTKAINEQALNQVNVAVSKKLKRGATVIVKHLLFADSPMPIRVSVVGEIPVTTASKILSSVGAARG